MASLVLLDFGLELVGFFALDAGFAGPFALDAGFAFAFASGLALEESLVAFGFGAA